MRKSLFLCVFLLVLVLSGNSLAAVPIKILPTKSVETSKETTQQFKKIITTQQIQKIITTHFNLNLLREIRVQLIVNKKHQPDHLLVYLLAKKRHKVEMARIDVDAQLNVLALQRPYRLEKSDILEQPGLSLKTATCPDTSIEFISFCPNDDRLEQAITKKVAKAAEAKSLKTVRLLLDDATRQNYLSYMKCPKLKGNFYDGDANPELITTVDGFISASDLDNSLSNQFNYKVTNIWLACEAFNDPMKTTMLTTVQSQKYAAGINDLLVGPSDRTAACTMIAGIAGKPLTDSFKACYQKYDNPEDQWGFDGDGSDVFGV